MLRPFVVRAVCATTLVVSALAWGWGHDGHRRLAANVHAPLPEGSCLRAWVQANQGPAFQELSVAPDEWKSTDPLEGDRHFLSIDYAQPASSYPREWSAVEAQFGRYARSNGQVPWRTEELYGVLVGDFAKRDSAQAAKTLAYLTHYVTDAFSILHDTRHYDGPPGQSGLHSRYETRMLNARSQMDDLTQRSRQYYGTLGRARPREQIFDIILSGHALVPELVAADLAAGGDTAKLYARTADMTARRWGDALTLLASLLTTAWTEAGAPLLPGMPQGCVATVATGEVVLKGYPLPGAQPTDANRPEGVEPSAPSGSEAEAPVGETQSKPPSAPSPGRAEEPSSPAACSAGAGALGLAGAFALLQGLAARRRRIRVTSGP